MSVTALLSAICIVLGVLVGFEAFEFLFAPLVWFVLAIALNTLPVTYTLGRKG